MYNGHMNFSVRKVIRRILYSTRCFTGSQCSRLRIGVMCADFLVLVTRRAAAFCTRWSFCSWVFGRPYSSALQQSILDVTNACTSCSAALWDRYFRMQRRLRRLWYACLTQLEMWCSIVMLQSKITPRSLAFSTGWIKDVPICKGGALNFASCCLDPNKRNSVLLSFSFR